MRRLTLANRPSAAAASGGIDAGLSRPPRSPPARSRGCARRAASSARVRPAGPPWQTRRSHRRRTVPDRPALGGSRSARPASSSRASSTRASRGIGAVGDDPPARRHRAHEVMELRFDRREVGKDVGVVELEVVQDRGPGTVMDELRALVEERGVVLVGFDHEVGRRREPRRDAEVLRHAADQEAGIARRRPRGSRRASRRWWSCRACRRPRARACRRGRSRRATAGPET